MYSAQFQRLGRAIDAIKQVIATSEVLRELLTDTASTSDQSDGGFARLRAVVPDSTAWRVYDHGAALTGLYGLYEEFVNDLVADWLGAIPAIYPTYSALPERVRRAHIEGVARILPLAGKGRYDYLGEGDVVSGLYLGASGATTFQLLREAFEEERILRRAELERLFASISMEGVWVWLSNNASMTAYIEKYLGNNGTIESELLDFVLYRNEVAHGSADQILGSEGLIRMCDFIYALCEALMEFVQSNRIKLMAERQLAEELGSVSERFRNGAVVSVMKQCRVKLDEDLWVMSQWRCYQARVKSIRRNDAPRRWVTVKDGVEIGFMFDQDVRKNSTLYRLR